MWVCDAICKLCWPFLVQKDSEFLLRRPAVIKRLTGLFGFLNIIIWNWTRFVSRSWRWAPTFWTGFSLVLEWSGSLMRRCLLWEQSSRCVQTHTLPAAACLTVWCKLAALTSFACDVWVWVQVCQLNLPLSLCSDCREAAWFCWVLVLIRTQIHLLHVSDASAFDLSSDLTKHVLLSKLSIRTGSWGPATPRRSSGFWVRPFVRWAVAAETQTFKMLWVQNKDSFSEDELKRRIQIVGQHIS